MIVNLRQFDAEKTENPVFLSPSGEFALYAIVPNRWVGERFASHGHAAVGLRVEGDGERWKSVE
ncbi:hypothetical protein ACUN9Y_20260 [Halomonas sp. V046]|uniref:hypothetical protein n=1 Tax=Halomonas sp. V046 TaxID=3459611 RepID=UPI004043DB7D